jgi:hypothetical protein
MPLMLELILIDLIRFSSLASLLEVVLHEQVCMLEKMWVAVTPSLLQYMD